MEKIHLNVGNKEAYKELIQFLEKFSKNELHIISESNFEQQKEDLQNELKATDEGTSGVMDIDDYDNYLEKVLMEYED